MPDRVAGLEAGADDYLVKPFDLDELIARLRALHRRAAPTRRSAAAGRRPHARPRLPAGPARGTEIELSAREFDILRLLMERAGRLVTRFTILDEVWDGETDLRSNVIDVHVAACAPRSTGRSAPTRSPRCAARATGSTTSGR